MEQKTVKPQNGKIIIKRPDGSVRVATANSLPSLTDQSKASQVDINNIMKKFKQTGLITHINTKTGTYGDLSDAPNLHDAMNVVAKAQESFDSLPATIRKKFGHDPQNLVDYLQDQKNYEESIELGLRIKQPAKELSLSEQITKGIKEAQPQK